jgi:hypothetical protein
MKKLFLLLAAFVATAVVGSATASAQEREKIVTATISNASPMYVGVLDEYIAPQVYSGSGVFSGLNVKLGAYYRKHDNLSWDLYYTSFHRPKLFDEASDKALWNPAKSQKLKYSSWKFGYGTYYHWNIGEKLNIKVGGLCDFYGEFKVSTPDGVNNNQNIAAQIMLKGQAAIKYGWDFNKWGLDLRANVTLPVIGLITADHPSEPAMYMLSSNDHSAGQALLKHVFLGFYHNYMSLDLEMGVDFVLKPFTIQLAYGCTNRWWNVYEVKNIRKIHYLSLGAAFDIVGRKKFKSSNNNF